MLSVLLMYSNNDVYFRLLQRVPGVILIRIVAWLFSNNDPESCGLPSFRERTRQTDRLGWVYKLFFALGRAYRAYRPRDHVVGVRQSLTYGRQRTFGSSLRWYISVDSHRGMILTGENQRTQRTTEFRMGWPGRDPGPPRCEAVSSKNYTKSMSEKYRDIDCWDSWDI
jgi:hypothetical protein